MADPHPCPACGSTRQSGQLIARDLRYGGEGDFLIVRCGDCGTGRTSPALEDVSRWYPDTYQNFLGRDSVFDRIFIRATGSYVGTRRTGRQRALAAVVPACDLGGTVTTEMTMLDVGAGSGHMVGALHRLGIDAWGVEPSSAAVQHATRRGVTTVEVGTLDTFIEAHPDMRWDVIRFWHTLEHMRSPADDLSIAAAVLKPGGRIVIGVPNFGGAMSRVMGPSWDGLEVPRHYTHFTRAGLRAVMERANLEVNRVRTVAVMGVTPASVLHRIGSRALPSTALMLISHPVEVALAAAGQGDGLLAIGCKRP